MKYDCNQINNLLPVAVNYFDELASLKPGATICACITPALFFGFITRTIRRFGSTEESKFSQMLFTKGM